MWAVLTIRSAAGWRKAFNTCSSHVAVVALFYGSIIFMYLQPAKRNSHEEGKLVALFYTVVTPMLNPLIYTLRNKTVKSPSPSAPIERLDLFLSSPAIFLFFMFSAFFRLVRTEIV